MALPSNSPYKVANIFCSACGEKMRVEIVKVGKGMIQGARAYCDSERCKYGYDISLEYANGVPCPYKPQMAKSPDKKFEPGKTESVGAPVGGAGKV